MNFNLIEVINTIIKSTELFPTVFAKNFVWVARNFTLSPEDLQFNEIKGIVNIFYEFIEPFSQSEYVNDTALVDIVQGLETLA